MDKETLRKTFIDRREQIPLEEARAAGKAIAALLFGQDIWDEARSIFCFISVGNEPDTSQIIDKALSDGKILCVPRTAPGRHMEAVPITLPATDTWNSGFERVFSDWPQAFGIPEPPSSYHAIQASSLDLVIVPSLALDKRGYRIGYGGGYYDSFIALFQTAQKRPFFAAIQFASLIQDDPLPHESHDMKVDLIVTERGILIPS